MRKNPVGWGVMLLAVVLACAVSACEKKTIPFQAAESGQGNINEAGAAGGLGSSDSSRWRDMALSGEQRRALQGDAAMQSFMNDDIYFDFDSFTLVDAAKKTLDRKAEFMNRHPDVKVIIEGHCDERGTHEYNLALGERRARSAWQYLVNSGVSQNRVTTVSYGQERPLSNGHDEASWAKNRRCHFDIPGMRESANQ
jgi:peptidoglycan-associated lipoprotein